jgi:hypothetical protein
MRIEQFFFRTMKLYIAIYEDHKGSYHAYEGLSRVSMYIGKKVNNLHLYDLYDSSHYMNFPRNIAIVENKIITDIGDFLLDKDQRDVYFLIANNTEYVKYIPKHCQTTIMFYCLSEYKRKSFYMRTITQDEIEYKILSSNEVLRLTQPLTLNNEVLESFWECYIKLFPRNISNIPQDSITYDICKYALAHGEKLENVILYYCDIDLCKIAVINKVSNILYVPRDLLTEDFFKSLVVKRPNVAQYTYLCYRSNSSKLGKELFDINRECFPYLRNRTLYMWKVMADLPYTLDDDIYIQDIDIDALPSIVKLGYTKNHQTIPLNDNTLELLNIFMTVIKKYYFPLSFISKKYRNLEICSDACKHDIRNLRYICRSR